MARRRKGGIDVQQTILPGLLLGLALACGTGPLAAQSALDHDDPQVTIQNNRNDKVTVYLDTGPFERTIGTVAPMSTRTFELPPWLVREQRSVRLLVKPEGGPAYEARAFVTDDMPRVGLLVEREEEDLEVMSADRVAEVLAGRELDGPTVTVRNAEDESAEVYILTGTLSHRLGRVGPGSITTFAIPAHMVASWANIVLTPEGGLPVLVAISLDGASHVGVDFD